MFKLVIQDDEGKTTVVPLIRDEITIGRKEGNTIRLTERNVSRRHARILRNNGEVHIEDLGSYNGIRVNNARIAERVSLRVSDQVQIGDYKLYLKAEGIEQVDDARTMPIERVEGAAGAPTDVIPAITPAVSITAQVPAQAASSTPVPPPVASAPQLIGNPARTMVAIAGEDAAGRPVATAAVVAALTAPGGYGKLVVLSSNFAGKEFELSRTQMIIGRTDENDIVVNHRSISRNHAKISREPETNRYTISDLNSSNGVRVNGQDYGKVELRRGDVVDLGHVRMRFIEAGEDFVFARDAQITDVPESGGKRGMLVAIVLGVVVLGAAVAFIMLHNSGGDPNNGTQPVAVIDAGSQTRVLAPDASTQIAVEPPVVVDAAVAVVETVDAAAPSVKPDDIAAVANTCKSKGTVARGEWTEEIDCANKTLRPLDPAAADALIAHARDEQAAKIQADTVHTQVLAKQFIAARTALDAIPKESGYASVAAREYSLGVKAEAKELQYDLNSRNQKDCKLVKPALVDDQKRFGNDVANLLVTPACPEQVTVDHHPGGGSATPPGPGSGSAAPCDAEAYKSEGRNQENNNAHAAALAQYELALKCKPDPYTYALAYMSACKSGPGNGKKAQAYYNHLPLTGSFSQQTLAAICVREGIDPKTGTKPSPP